MRKNTLVSIRQETLGIIQTKKGNDKMITHDICFIDSYKFMATSLNNLVKNLSKENFIQTRKTFGEKFELLTRKGVYPFDYMNSFEKFNETELPRREEFYSKLNDSEISF